MDVPSYQQLLAEVYDETPKHILMNTIEYDEDIEPNDNHPDELENQEDFQKFHGSRQDVEIQHTIPEYVDKTKLSLSYDKDVKVRVINVDSRFRTPPNDVIATSASVAKLQDSSTDFMYKLKDPVKNVISIRLSSIEIPNTYYNFSDSRGNISFRIYYPSGQTGAYYDVVITEGNYFVDTSANLLPNNLIIELQTKLNTNSLGLNFSVIFNVITSRLTIQETTNKLFDIDFTQSIKFPNRKVEWGLGYNLGFRNQIYYGGSTYTGETIVDALGSNYLFLSLHPDWKIVRHTNEETTELTSFAKIVVTEPKNAVIYDNGSNTITKEYWFDKPHTIRSFHVTLTDAYEQPLDLMGQSMSFTIELKEIMNTSLYNHYVNQQHPTRDT